MLLLFIFPIFFIALLKLITIIFLLSFWYHLFVSFRNIGQAITKWRETEKSQILLSQYWKNDQKLLTILRAPIIFSLTIHIMLASYKEVLANNKRKQIFKQILFFRSRCYIYNIKCILDKADLQIFLIQVMCQRVNIKTRLV